MSERSAIDTAFLISTIEARSTRIGEQFPNIAELYAECLKDGTVFGSVTEVESFTTGLTRKIWQKLMIVHSTVEQGVA